GLGTKKPDSAPLLVKSNPAGTKTQAQSQESAPPLPSPLAVASAAVTSNDSALSGLLSSASSSLSKPSLATARVSQGVSQGLLIKRVQPRYPQAALAVHAQGAVQIEATINKEGSVTNLKVLSGDPILARAALEAVRQWRYKPYYLDGEPIEMQADITVFTQKLQELLAWNEDRRRFVARFRADPVVLPSHVLAQPQHGSGTDDFQKLPFVLTGW